MDIVLFKDGSYKFIDSDSYYKKKKEEIKVILVNCKSKILGEFYTPIAYKNYKRIKTQIESYNFKFTFYKGVYVDTDSDFRIITKYEEDFKLIGDLLAKRAEIVFSEYSLRDLFWAHNSFYNNYFDDIKVKVKLRNKNKRVKYGISEFMGEYIYDGEKSLFSESVDIVNKTDYNLVTRYKDITGKNITLVRISEVMFIPANSKYISKITSLSTETNLYLGDEDLKLDEMNKKELKDFYYSTTSFNTEEEKSYKKNWVKSISAIWEIPMHMYLLNTTIYGEDELTYMSVLVKNICKVGFNKNKPEKIKWTEVYNNMFDRSLVEESKKKVKPVELVPKGRLAERMNR